MSLLELIVSPSVLIGIVIGVTAAVAIGKFFPEHDLSLLQALAAVGASWPVSFWTLAVSLEAKSDRRTRPQADAPAPGSNVRQQADLDGPQ